MTLLYMWLRKKFSKISLILTILHKMITKMTFEKFYQLGSTLGGLRDLLWSWLRDVELFSLPMACARRGLISLPSTPWCVAVVLQECVAVCCSVCCSELQCVWQCVLQCVKCSMILATYGTCLEGLDIPTLNTLVCCSHVAGV